MFRNYLTTALNNLLRNRLYAAITILGLAVAFAVAILVGQFARHEFTYDHWIPGHERIYKLTERIDIPGRKPVIFDGPATVAGELKNAVPGLTLARLSLQQQVMRRGPGDEGAPEGLAASVDPDFFKVLPLPALAGDPAAAMQAPDAVVLTRRMARKYFGQDLPIGRTLEQQDQDGRFHTLRVAAVLKDLPTNTNLGSEIFASGRSAWSRLSFADAHPLGHGASYAGITTFVRMPSSRTTAALDQALDAAAKPIRAEQPSGIRIALGLTALDEAHWIPVGVQGPGVKPSGDKIIAYGIVALAALIVAVAAINFVTLMTARAARRGVEVGVRKVTGARRRDLILQFMGEALIQVAISVVIAAALAEALIAPFDALVQRDLGIDFVHDPSLLACLVGFALVVGGLAALYPAFVLSGFRPSAVLKGGVVQTVGSPRGRATMVAIQFAVLVGLIFTTTTIYRQTRFALAQGIGGSDSRLIATVSTSFGGCKGAFLEEVRAVHGVSEAACSSSYTLLRGVGRPVSAPGGAKINFWVRPTSFGALELFGVRPIAGRLFSRSHPEDGVLTNPASKLQPTVVINQTAARILGYANPSSAIGKPMRWSRAFGPDETPVDGPSEIIGVVPDMPETLTAPVDPSFFFVSPKYLDMASVRLTGEDVAGAMRGIESAWKRAGGGSPFKGAFLSQMRLNTYADLVVQSETIAICAGLAILIACIGLFALAAYMTERRTKEIGIRKAMGAGALDVVLLLIWQFTAPVLSGVAVALPLGFIVMSDWLHHFAYRVPLSLWTFLLAGAAALLIAWLTVSYQSWTVARAKPAGALQYE